MESKTWNMGKKLRVALLAGGASGERDVSLRGAGEVEKVLDPAKYQVRRYDPATDIGLLVRDAADIDVAFILLHGPLGEDGTVQGFLDLLNIPYQGSGVLGSAIAMDKNLAKILYRNAGLKVPEWEMLYRDRSYDCDRLVVRLGLPLVVKPIRQGSSLGMSIVDSAADLDRALEKAFLFDREVMVEQYVDGREITVGVLGNNDLVALPLVEIIPDSSHRFFDYDAKYTAGVTKEVCPADFDATVTEKARQMGLAAHQALQLRGYSRTDMIVAGEEIYILETNTIPGMTPTSLLPQAAKVYGLSFAALIDHLISLALEGRDSVC